MSHELKAAIEAAKKGAEYAMKFFGTTLKNGKIWDIAPFKVIIEEAGGELMNWQGKPWTIKDLGCIATNRLLSKEVMRITNP